MRVSWYDFQKMKYFHYLLVLFDCQTNVNCQMSNWHLVENINCIFCSSPTQTQPNHYDTDGDILMATVNEIETWPLWLVKVDSSYEFPWPDGTPKAYQTSCLLFARLQFSTSCWGFNSSGDQTGRIVQFCNTAVCKAFEFITLGGG